MEFFMNLPKITIVTPSFNQRPYIEETIRSILDQNYPNLQFMVLDGGSTDGSKDVIQKYEGRFDYWRSYADGGQTAAISEGLARADGDIFAWVNSDDVLFSGCLQAVAGAFSRANQPDIIHANVAYIDSTGIVKRLVKAEPQRPFFVLRGAWQSTAPCIFFKTQSLRDIGGLCDELRLSMDYDLWLRLMIRGAHSMLVPKYFGAFRWHQNAKTFVSSSTRSSEENSETQQLFAELLPEKKDSHRRFWRRVFRLYRCAKLSPLHERIHLRQLGLGLHWREIDWLRLNS
jgi:glycosyltransferase involved in cell wall biosynthesis